MAVDNVMQIEMALDRKKVPHPPGFRVNDDQSLGFY